MFCVILSITLIVSHSYGGTVTILGGKQPLTGDDFGSAIFGELVQKANHECNSVGSYENWYKPDAILGGTKQVVSGTLYEFGIRQRGTHCKREDMLKRGPGEPEQFCLAKENSTAVCSVKIHHKPWMQFTETKVGDIWVIDTEDSVISEEVRTFNDSYTGFEKQLIERAIEDYHTRGDISNLYKFVNAIKTTRKNDGKSTHELKVFIKKTKCQKEKLQLQDKSYKKDKCYNEEMEENLNCKIPLEKEAVQLPKFSQCDTEKRILRGMWRSLAQQPNESTICRFGQNKQNQTNSSIPVWPPLKNHARSNIRYLSLDEVNGKPFKELLEELLANFIVQNGSTNAYKIHKVENAKIETDPSATTTFSVWVGISPCITGGGYSTSNSTHVTMCESSDQNQQIEKCQVTVTSEKTKTSMRNITISSCKLVLGASFFLIGGSVYAEAGSKSHGKSLTFAQRAVELYNSESNELYEYQLDNMLNPVTKSVSGTQYTMNITMQAVGCKNRRDSDCLNSNQEEYKHCVVSALEDPSKHNSDVNITNCWRHVILKQAIKGEWEFLSPEQLYQLRQGQLTTEVMKQYQKQNKHLEKTNIDYTTGGIKLTDGQNDVIYFNMHLKGTEANPRRFKCEVVVIQMKGQPPTPKLRTCLEKDPPVEIKRMLGAPKMMDEESQSTPQFKRQIEESVEKFNRITNDLYFHRLLRIENPGTQVVAGKLTTFKMHMQQTNCTKEKHTLWHATNLPHLCGSLNNTHTTTCLVKIWEKPWENFVRVEVEKCKLSTIDFPLPLQSDSDDIQATDAFGKLVKSAVMIFNLNSDERVLYEDHLVDEITRSVDKPNEIEFNLNMKATNCRKWDDLITFKDGYQEWCPATIPPTHFVQCKVKTTEKPTGASIILSNCEYIYFGNYSEPRPFHGQEKTLPHLQKVVKNAVNLFNARMSSPFWYSLLTIEDPTIEYVSGLRYSLKLHLLPTTCRPANGVGNCTQSQPQFMVTCQVHYWMRAWSTQQETLDVGNCELTPITRNFITEETPSVERVQRLEENKRCLFSLEKRLLKLFTEKYKTTQPYRQVTIENIEEDIAPGGRLKFDLYLKPEINFEMCAKNAEESCSEDNHFYVCKGSFWSKPWLAKEFLELGQCMKITSVNVPSTEQYNHEVQKQQEMKDAAAKAVELYNEKLAEFYYFEKEDVQKFSVETTLGKKTTFDLVLKPNSCKPTLGRRRCEPHLSKSRVRCSVTIWSRPWLGEDERIWLRDCYEYFAQDKAVDTETVSEEEKASVAFREFLKQLPGLYAGAVPIKYNLENYENAMVRENDSHRVLTLSFILEPSGCDYEKTNADDPACRDWKNQDKVRCDAERIQSFPLTGPMMTTIRLTGCSAIMKPVKKRVMKPSEYESITMRMSLKSAWNLFHQINANSPQLYRVIEIKDGMLERQDVERVTYNLVFEETVCVRGQDEHRFIGVHAPGCDAKEPSIRKTCEVEVVNDKRGQNVSLSCSAR